MIYAVFLEASYATQMDEVLSMFIKTSYGQPYINASEILNTMTHMELLVESDPLTMKILVPLSVVSLVLSAPEKASFGFLSQQAAFPKP